MSKAPTQDILNKLKSIKLPGEFPLKRRPVLPDIVLFSDRPKEFINELRRIRENLPFKAGPSKKRSTVGGDEGESLLESVEGGEAEKTATKGRARRTTSKKKSEDRRATALGRSDTKMSQDDKAALLRSLGF